MLWKKVMSGLSAGRVQSVATRLVVDKERDRMKFRVASYWDLEGTFDAGAEQGPADVPGPAALDRRRPGRQRLRLRRRRRAQGQEGRPGPPRPRRRRGARRGAARHVVRRPLGRGQALPPLALRAVPHHHAPAGGQPQARHDRLGDDVGRAAALRERLHHLHAHRLDDAVGHGGRRGPVAGPRALRRGVPPRRAAHLRQQGQERPGGARGDPPVRRVLPHARRRPG